MTVYSIASGIFEITVLVLGGDLLLDACSDKVSSFIYWYYWTDHFAKFLAISFLQLCEVEALKPLDKQLRVAVCVCDTPNVVCYCSNCSDSV